MEKGRKVWVITFGALALGTITSVFYPHSFITWDLLAYAFCIAGFVAAAYLLLWAVLLSRGVKKKAPIFAIIGAAVYVGLFFGVATLVHAVICKEKDPWITTTVISALNVALYLTCLLLVRKNVGSKFFPRAFIGCLLIFVVIAVSAFGMVSESVIDYYKAVTEARHRDNFVLPENASVRTEPDYGRDVRLFVNIDETSQVPDYMEYLNGKETITEDDLMYYVKPYYNTQVTDVLFGICGQSSMTQSEYITWRGDKVKWTEEDGHPVDYSSIPYWMYRLQEEGIDPVPYWLKGCRDNGINPWLTFRMNDCHDSDKETSFLRGELFYRARDNGWMIGKEYGYYHTCFDYSVSQIRETMLNYIREQTLRYGPYGIELDWQREMYCFDYLHEDNEKIVGVMNGFMRDVSAVVREAENRWGHDIKITARLMRDIDQCKVFGFDVRTWEKEGLIDGITVTPRFTSCDSDMDIAKWKKELPSIEIYAGIETRVCPDGTCVEGAVANAAVARGYAAQYLSQGADGAYFFNYFAYPKLERNEELYNTCGTLFTALNSYRRHVMTFQDIAPEGEKRYEPLPVASLKNHAATLSQKTGFIPDGATVRVYVGFFGKIKASQVTVTNDGSACSYGGEASLPSQNENTTEPPIENGYLPQGSRLYVFTVQDPAKVGDVSYVTVRNNGVMPLIVTYLEIEIVPLS